MAHDDRPGDDPMPKRRGKAPVITLAAQDVTPAAAAEPSAPQEPGTDAPIPAPPETPEMAATSETVTPSPVDPMIGTAAPASGDAAEAPEALPGEPESSDAIPPDATVPPAEAAGLDPVAAVEEPAPVAPAPAEPAPAPSSGFGRLVAAGLVGALLTGGLGVAAIGTGLLPLPSGDAADRDARIGALEAQMRQVSARPATPTAAAAPDLSPLTRRIEAVDAARATLEGRIAALEQRPPGAVGATAPGSAAPALDLGPLRAEIEALKADVARLAARPEGQLPAVASSDIDARIAGAVTAAREAAERRIADLDAQVRAARSALADLAPKIATLETARGETSDAGRRAAFVVSLGALRAAVERGQSYAAELRAAAGLGLPQEAAKTLEAHAERGLLSLQALSQRFSTLAPDLVKAAPQPPGGGTLLERLTTSAQSLVRVRPVGEAAGDDVPTVVARIEAKLRRADLAGALADLDKLPEQVKTSAAAWAAEARARLAADTTLRRLSAEAAAAMGGG